MVVMLYIFVIVLGLIGIMGCVLPIIPGPPISYAALFIVYYWGQHSHDHVSSTVMIVLLVATIIATVLDYILPSKYVKKYGGSRAGSVGALIGMLLGITFSPVGMIIGSFVGAFAGELLISRKDSSSSLRAAFGSFMGFLVSTGLKLIVSFIIFFYIIMAMV